MSSNLQSEKRRIRICRNRIFTPSRYRVTQTFLALLTLIALSGCGFLSKKNAYWNTPVGAAIASNAGINYNTPNRLGSNEDTLFILAASGGGSRAAIFSTYAMLQLENRQTGMNLLNEVDAISSVSGGSVPTSYYAVSRTAEPAKCGKFKKNPASRPIWNESVAIKRMSSNFQGSWFRRWFLPQNALRFWFTSFDRSDIMAQVFKKKIGRYNFGDICKDKPRIFINATRATYDREREAEKRNRVTGHKPDCLSQEQQKVGGVFTFTDCEFDNLNSSLSQYPIANAVVASSAFPAVFNYTTLRDFTEPTPQSRYLHLYDGGSRDNLGLSTVSQVIEASSESYKRIVVLLIDAYLEPQGISSTLPDARIGVDFIIDTNFLDSIDTLLSTNHDNTIAQFNRALADRANVSDIDTFFYHLSFLDLENDSTIRDTVNGIKTSFKIGRDEVQAIQQATDELYNKNDGGCFKAMQKFVAGEPLADLAANLSDNFACQLNLGKNSR